MQDYFLYSNFSINPASLQVKKRSAERFYFFESTSYKAFFGFDISFQRLRQITQFDTDIKYITIEHSYTLHHRLRRRLMKGIHVYADTLCSDAYTLNTFICQEYIACTLGLL